MERQIEQIDRVFENSMKIEKDEEIELFIRQFESGTQEYCRQKEHELIQPVESINDGMVRLIDQYKQKQYSRTQQNDNQQIINHIKQQYEDIVNQSEQIINQQRNRYDSIMTKYDGRLQYIKQLEQSENKIIIYEYDDLDEYRKQIEEYQQYGQQYQITVNFGYDLYSIDSKMSVLRMIDRLDANNKVGIVIIKVSGDHKLDDQILAAIMDRYTKVYWIQVYDDNNQVDYKTHELIRQWVQYQPIIGFTLLFKYGSILCYNNDGFKLVKQYNQLIRYKDQLEKLRYSHDRIGSSYARSKQMVEELITKVDKA